MKAKEEEVPFGLSWHDDPVVRLYGLIKFGMSSNPITLGTKMENRKILVIEDNELNMKLMHGVLRIDNYQLIEAFDAETGIRLARQHRPFLILMDIQLPGMDGLQATRIIKADSDLKNIPVVAITGFAMQGDEEKAIASGCDGYITKPFDIQELLEKIDSYYKKQTPDWEKQMVLK